MYFKFDCMFSRPAEPTSVMNQRADGSLAVIKFRYFRSFKSV